MLNFIQKQTDWYEFKVESFLKLKHEYDIELKRVNVIFTCVDRITEAFIKLGKAALKLSNTYFTDKYFKNRNS